MTFHAVTDLEQLGEERVLRVKAGAAELIVLSSNGQLRAFQADCPHAGAPLDEGAICEGYLICPWHKAAFALDSGEVCEPPALTHLKRHALRVESGKVWVDDQPMPRAEMPAEADNRCFVVIGAGAAGTAAVASLRAKGYGGRLVWIDQEQPNAYDRTALSKFVLAGEMSAAQVPPLLSDEVYKDPGVQRLHGQVRRIDSHTKTISLDDGRSLTYDAALLATGGIAQRPNIEGMHLPGVFVLRSLNDAEQLMQAVEAGSRVVIIGDSFIGLEAAAALRKSGAEVHVVSRHQVPVARQMGERIGRALRQLHESHGVIFHSGTEPLLLEGAAQVLAVRLDNGERIETELVLVGTGVTPATEAVHELARVDDQSLPVDAGMGVTDGLWAAGDIVTFPLAGRPVRIEHWRVAQQQARVAVANMLGEPCEFADVPFFWTYHYGKTYEVLGHARDWNHIDYIGEPEQHAFMALLCIDEQVEAVIACEHEKIMAVLSQRMKRPLSRSEALAMTGQ